MTGELDQDTAWLERIGAKTPGEAAAADDNADEVETEDEADEDYGDDDDDDDRDRDDDDDEQDEHQDDYGDDAPDPAGYDLDDYNHRYTDPDDEQDEDDEGRTAFVESVEPLHYSSDDTDLGLEPEDEEPVNRRFKPWVLAAGAAAVAAAAVATTVLANINTADPDPAPTTGLSPTTTARPTPPPAPPAPPPPVDDIGDVPIPFTAHSDCNPAGSTPAQSIAVPDSPTPWICVIEGPGQVLDIQLGPPGMPQSYVITRITIVPGAIAKPGRPPTEPDPWLQHHVVTRIQFGFNDTANTTLPLNTGNVHGEVPMPVPRLVASHITAIIQETSRPPAPQPIASENQDSGGVFGGILGPAPASTSAPALPGADTPSQPDISDRTFAVTSIKIIGHKANQ